MENNILSERKSGISMWIQYDQNIQNWLKNVKNTLDLLLSVVFISAFFETI